MKKINHILFIMAATAALMIAGCRKDNPYEKYASAEFSFTFTEDRTYMSGQTGNYCSWNYSGGKIVSEKHPDEVFHFTNGNMVRIVAKSSDPSFQGVGVEAPEGVFCSHNNFDKAKGEDTWDLWKISKTENWDDDATDGTVRIYCGDNVKEFPVKICYNLVPKFMFVTVNGKRYSVEAKQFDSKEAAVEYGQSIGRSRSVIKDLCVLGSNGFGYPVEIDFSPGSAWLTDGGFSIWEWADGQYLFNPEFSPYPTTVSVTSNKSVKVGASIEQVFWAYMNTRNKMIVFSFLLKFENKH